MSTRPDKTKGEALAKMLWWAIHDGQQYTQSLSYGGLAAPVVAKAESQVLSIKYQGQALVNR